MMIWFKLLPFRGLKERLTSIPWISSPVLQQANTSMRSHMLQSTMVWLSTLWTALQPSVAKLDLNTTICKIWTTCTTLGNNRPLLIRIKLWLIVSVIFWLSSFSTHVLLHRVQFWHFEGDPWEPGCLIIRVVLYLLKFFCQNTWRPFHPSFLVWWNFCFFQDLYLYKWKFERNYAWSM